MTPLWSSPEAPRAVDAPVVGARPDHAGWVAALDVPAREGLHGRLVSELLLGEPVQVVAERSGWADVRAVWQPTADPAGYPGWLPRAHLADRPAPATEVAVVTGRSTRLHGPSSSGESASWGTVLPVERAVSDRVYCRLPGGRNGWLSAADAEIRPEPAASPVDRAALLRAATRFTGLPYLWGGTSADGVDCSGLVHLAHRSRGLIIPRDADDQQAAARPVDVGSAEPGDLYFFARPGEPVHHVGLVTGPHRMLHAPEAGSVVEEVSLSPDRLATLVAAGRFGR